MAKPDAVFIYIGTYPDEAAARAGYDVVKDLHAAGAVEATTPPWSPNDDAGKVHVSQDAMATRHGRVGAALTVGAVVGILFPPAIIGTAVVGAAVGGVGGHLWRGMSRSDVKEFGEFIEWLAPPVADRRPTEGEAAWWARNPTLPIWRRLTISSS